VQIWLLEHLQAIMLPRNVDMYLAAPKEKALQGLINGELK